MLPIELFRENPEIIRNSEKKRFKDISNIDKVIDLDNKWRESLQKVEKLRHNRNLVTKEISEMKKKGISTKSQISEMKKVSEEINKLTAESNQLLEKRNDIMYCIGNILDENVPISKTEEGNIVIKKWGKISNKKTSHFELTSKIANIEKASEVSGSRFYYLIDKGAILNLALINYCFNYFKKKGFTSIWPPYVLKEKYMKEAAELSDFKEQLYKLENEDSYLIATAEQPLVAYHSNEILENLPKKYVGFSTNFRKEAGSHGKDTKGIFRTHSFDKVEQVIICDPSESNEWHNKMISFTEDLIKGLDLPYRIVNIASGEMNDNGAKKYDIEVWFPSQEKYRELGSGTNCTDYQARKLNMQQGKIGGEKKYVHTLNCTGLAIGRTISAILENHQQKNGIIKIPRKLRKYTGFKKIE